MTTGDPTKTYFGATPEEWRHFVSLGMTRDLLPVVSDPTAKLSPLSKMKGLGKTPSRYTSDGVAGIPQWTSRQTTEDLIARWIKEPNYGICLQTRRVRAIDVDITDDDTAEAILSFIAQWFHLDGIRLPMRWRTNSPKFLLAFELPDTSEQEWCKRILRCEHGIIEFLANGQQFIAAGTHTSGERYQWLGGLPASFPVIAAEDFEGLWSQLETKFAIEKSIEARTAKSLKQKRLPPTELDPVALYLDEHGWAISMMRDGRINMTCPWENEHTSGENETATQYFPPGVGGFEQGHFKCLHAHCTHRTDQDFLTEIGYTAKDFSVVTFEGHEPANEGDLPQGDEEAWPALHRAKDGSIFATIGNLVKAVGCAPMVNCQIRFDTFRDEILLGPVNQPPGSFQWRAFTDADYTRLRITLERRGFMPVGKEIIRDVVLKVADENQFDSAILWLESLKWDGVPRVDRFFPHYLGTSDNEYTRACSHYLWTALAGRVLAPGCKADMVPVLIGLQGIGKSTAVAAIAPSVDQFCEINLMERDDDASRLMRGRLVGEIGELRGLHSRDAESIKAYITRTHENWTPKYREFSTKFARRLVFVGTTNQEEFLTEDQNRRWLPLRCTAARVEEIREHRDQLWAEGAAQWREHGIRFAAAEGLAKNVHEEHRIGDTLEGPLLRWLETVDLDGARTADRALTMDDILQGIGIDPRKAGRREELRISTLLRQHGWDKIQVRVGHQRAKRWVRISQTNTNTEFYGDIC